MAELKIGSKEELEKSKKKREKAQAIAAQRRFTLNLPKQQVEYPLKKGKRKGEDKLVGEITGMPSDEEFYGKGASKSESFITEGPEEKEEEKGVNDTKPLPDNIKAAAEEAIKKGKPEPSLDDVEPSTQDKPETGSMSDGLKDALMYLGPRLGGLLIGGYEGYQEADKLATGFQKYQAGQKGLAGRSGKYQQLQGLRDEQGRPLWGDPATGTTYTVDGKEYKGKYKDPVSGRLSTRLDWKKALAGEVTTAQFTRLEGLRESAGWIRSLDGLLKKVDTGQISSRKQSIKAFFGKASNEFVQLKSQTGFLQQSFRKITTGAQASQQELDALFELLPSINDYMPTYKAKMKAYQEMIRIKGDALVDAMTAGYPLKKETILEITALLKKDRDEEPQPQEQEQEQEQQYDSSRADELEKEVGI